MESGKCELEHELVGRGEGPNEYEVQVGCGAGQDEMGWEGVYFACSPERVNATSMLE